MELSIVSTLYRSAPWLQEFYTRISATAQTITAQYELILVNDGSPDNVLDIALQLQRTDPRVTVVDLSRNFGHHKAIMTGLSHAKGDTVFLIDCDLEEPPEMLKQFWQSLKAHPGTDMIYGVQQDNRKGGPFERITGSIYYTLFNFLSDIKIERNMSVMRIMTRRYLDNLLLHKEQELVFAGIAALTGYKQASLEFIKSSKGSSTYSLSKKLTMVANSIASFSNKPLLYIFFIGLFMTIFFGGLSFFYLVRHFVYHNMLSGWTSLIISIWAIGGMLLLAIGIIGIYLAKIFTEVKQRPYTIIRNIYKS